MVDAGGRTGEVGVCRGLAYRIGRFGSGRGRDRKRRRAGKEKWRAAKFDRRRRSGVGKGGRGRRRGTGKGESGKIRRGQLVVSVERGDEERLGESSPSATPSLCPPLITSPASFRRSPPCPRLQRSLLVESPHSRPSSNTASSRLRWRWVERSAPGGGDVESAAALGLASGAPLTSLPLLRDRTRGGSSVLGEEPRPERLRERTSLLSVPSLVLLDVEVIRSEVK